MLVNSYKEKTTSFFDTVLLYLFLLFSCGFYFHEHRISFTGPIVIAMIILIKNGNYKFQKRAVAVLCALIANIIISYGFANDSLENFFLSVSSVASAFIISTSFPKKAFLRTFVNLIFILCIGSSAIFVINVLWPNLLTAFPKLVDSHNVDGFFTVFSVATMKTEWVAARNASVFWEPGVFQTFIILAFSFEMSKYGMRRKAYGIVFLLTIMTTLSTTGIVGVAIMTVIWLLEINREKKLRIIRIIASLVFLAALAITVFRFIPQGIVNKPIDKFFNVLDGDTSNFSVTSRVDSIIYPLQSFFSSPIIGVGSSGLSEWKDSIGHSLRTCTPLNWFARFGIVFGVIANIGFTQVLDKMYNVKICNIMLPILLLLSIFTEAYTVNPAILVFVFYGFYQTRQTNPLNEEGNTLYAV